jgi:SAM-dependent methyltransferase
VKLNLGCGRNPLDGYTNVDRKKLPGVDVVCDLERGRLPFDTDTATEIVGVDLIEHIANVLPLMQELWRVAQPGARCRFELPYGSSDDAWEDPTHVRPYFLNSWSYFAQPFYYRADYGYRGDWQPVAVILDVNDTVTPQAELQAQVLTMRNIVARQTVELTAVKPAREPLRELIVAPQISFRRSEV